VDLKTKFLIFNINMYPDLKTVDNHGNSVLHIAAQNGRAGVIEDLILKGADVNYGTVHVLTKQF
jgi:ankyrin repeat protein